MLQVFVFMRYCFNHEDRCCFTGLGRMYQQNHIVQSKDWIAYQVDDHTVYVFVTAHKLLAQHLKLKFNYCVFFSSDVAMMVILLNV